MARLIDVFCELFRSHGYTTAVDHQVTGASGRTHELPLVIERDARRVAAFPWVRGHGLDPAFLQNALESAKDTGCETALIFCLAPVSEPVLLQARRDGALIWDSRRLAQELGEAVLYETCPEVWARVDPLLAPRSSRVIEAATRRAVPDSNGQQSLPLVPLVVPPADPVAEAPFSPTSEPLLAGPAQQPMPELQLPPAFSFFDSVVTATAPTSIAAAPVATARPARSILKSQVTRGLALSLVKNKIRTVDKIFLRLVPYYVYDYEAHLLVDGSLDAELKRGRMAIDAAQRRVVEWTLPLETGDLSPEGCDVDEKKVRLTDTEAQALLKGELTKLVTRDVVLEEDADEWSVVVKKKVTLGPDDVKLATQGLYWMPVWRASGKDGAIEIDASTGTILFEEILSQRTDAQLI